LSAGAGLCYLLALFLSSNSFRHMVNNYCN
jgi:hypothetical protein